MLFKDDIVLICEMHNGVNYRLEVLRSTIESKGFRLSKNKIEDLKHNDVMHERILEVKIRGQVIPKRGIFMYLASVILGY